MPRSDASWLPLASELLNRTIGNTTHLDAERRNGRHPLDSRHGGPDIPVGQVDRGRALRGRPGDSTLKPVQGVVAKLACHDFTGRSE